MLMSGCACVNIASSEAQRAIEDVHLEFQQVARVMQKYGDLVNGMPERAALEYSYEGLNRSISDALLKGVTKRCLVKNLQKWEKETGRPEISREILVKRHWDDRKRRP